MAAPRCILFADDDKLFIETMTTESKSGRAQPCFAANRKEAQITLADRSKNISGIFVNPEMSECAGIYVIRFAHQLRPTVPVYLLHQGKSDLAQEKEMQKLGVQGARPKPISYKTLESLVIPAAISFDPSSSMELAKNNGEAVGEEFAADDANFISVRAQDFLAGTKSFFDLYIHLGPGKYVKILNAGDAFPQERLAGYLTKGVNHFFLKKEAQQLYVSYCDKVATAVLARSSTPTEVKARRTFVHGEEMMGFLRKNGLDDSSMSYATSFASNAGELARTLSFEKNDVLKGFMADLASYDHGVSTAMVASLLIRKLFFGASKPVQIVGIASLFHDVGLFKVCPELGDKEDPSGLSAEKLALFHTHPTVGAELLSKVPGVDPVAIQAVSQHHERRNKTGFPSRLSTGSINRVAEIVGISDELVNLLQKASSDPKIRVFDELEERIFHGFSYSITEAFRALFFPQQEKKRRAS